jgi:ketosteroid isomerase-like protein
MASKTMHKTLLGLETRYWEALKDKNVEAALELTADPCVVVGAQGVARVDTPMYEQMMRDSSWTIVDFKIGDEVQVEMLGRNAAIVAYTVHEDLTVDGEPLSLDAADTSTWVRSDGAWKCAMHTESVLGDPYGRTSERTQF